MSSDLDIGPLSWVKSEIDLALERAGAALSEHAQDTAGAGLATAVRQLHQAHGALMIVGLDGITEFSEALEQLFTQLAEDKLPWSEAVAHTAQNGLAALRGYLDGLMAGEANQPLRLMPAYTQLITATGAATPAPSALFFPDLSQRPPRRETEPPLLPEDKLAARVKMARMGFERGLLKWLKGSEDEAVRGIGEMKNAVTMIEATQVQPGDRAFWWIAIAFFDVLAKGAFADASLKNEARKLAMKIGAQIKHFSEGRREVADRLYGDALYLIVIAGVDSEHANVVRAAYRLDALIPKTTSTDLEALRPQIRRMREIIAGAKDDWNKLCSGTAAALPPFHEKASQLYAAAAGLNNDGINGLCLAIAELTDHLRRDPSRHTDAMALEVATALLLCDSALENFAALDEDFTHHAEVMAERLETLTSSRDLAALELPHLDAMARRAQERLLLSTVAHEITANLSAIEQTLDAYFRDTGKQANLHELDKPLKQIEGALLILGQDRAVAVLAACARQIRQLASGELRPESSVLEALASQLSGLGFFIEQLELGTQPDIDAILTPQKIAAPAEPAPVVIPEPLAPVNDVDSELLDIFLEEAREVLASISEHLPRMHAQPADQGTLTTLRRSFHTLKGSGRMVKLHELGEAAWGVEQVLNLWLQDQQPANAALLHMLDLASTLFADWVAQLADGGNSERDASELAAQCARLLAGDATEAAVIAEPEDNRSAADMVAALEAQEAARQESELAAAEMLAAQLAAESANAAPVTPTTPATPATPATEPSHSEDDAVSQGLTFAPTLPTVSEDELAAAELAAAEIMAAAAEDTPPSTSSTSPAEATGDTSDVRPFPAPPPIRIGTVEISPTLFAIYLEEARDHLATIQSEISGIGVPTDRLIRAAHTLASTSGTTGLAPLHHLARALEMALGALAIVNVAPTETQRLLLARCAGALEGMFGAIQSRRMPAEEETLGAELHALQPEPTSAPTSSPSTAATATPVAEFALPADASAAEKPAAEPAPSAAEARLGLRLDDEIDEQLLPIYLEEAVDLMASIDAQLRGWRSQPDNETFARQLQRDLHTIKGSARMAGAMGCGDVFHSMESRIEQSLATHSITPELFDTLETSYDRGAWLIDRLQRGEFATTPMATTPVAAAPATELASTVTDDSTEADNSTSPAQTDTSTTMPGTPTSGPVHLRVRASLIDSLVNEAGEVAIARARIEGEMRALKASLLDLTENVIRLRQQVREIEIQAETQMSSQLTELKAQAERDGRHFDPLEFDRFTRFQELTRMMAESVNDVSTVQHSLLANVTTTDAALNAQARLSRELSQRLMGMRMMPFDSLAERLHRVVRQAAKDAGKRANLDIKGGQMGIDRSVLEHIGAPLEHLLRNAVAHGIETPEQREANGKEALGQITLALAQEGNDVVLSLSDDGAGLDLARIRRRAGERGLITAESASDDAQLIGMIFQSGFTTASEVSALAGRGIGMDVVKTEVEGLGGRIEVSTSVGKGSTFRLYLPLTLAVSQAVIVRVGSRSYALPASMVEQASELKPEVIEEIRTTGHTEWLGRTYPYRYLPRLLGLAAQPTTARRHWLLLIKGGTERLALEVDGMIGNREIVIKDLGQQLRRIPGLAGATVLGTGEIALILNPIALLARHSPPPAAEAKTAAPVAATVSAPDELPASPAISAAPAAEATIMVVDDSLTVRKVTGRLLGRNGYQVVTAKDGVDALEQLEALRPAVMLVDIEMPRMDGFELARNIRADAKLRDIPIIMITSRSAEKHRQYAREIGVNHYLGKPYDEALLLDLIASFIKEEKPS